MSTGTSQSQRKQIMNAALRAGMDFRKPKKSKIPAMKMLEQKIIDSKFILTALVFPVDGFGLFYNR